MRLNLQTWIDYNIYCWGHYEYYLTRFFKQQIKADTIFLDVGAYIGQYAQLAAYTAQEGKVYAFEPNPESVKRLREHIHENQFNNIVVIPKGVGAEEHVAKFFVGQQPFQSSLIDTHAHFKEIKEIPIISLDTFCAREGITRVDLLKIDVEEAEDDVIKGAKSILQTTRPLIFLEVGRQAIDSGDPESLRELRSLNYQFFILMRTKLQPLPKQLSAGQEVIAVPEEKMTLFL